MGQRDYTWGEGEEEEDDDENGIEEEEEVEDFEDDDIEEEDEDIEEEVIIELTPLMEVGTKELSSEDEESIQINEISSSGSIATPPPQQMDIEEPLGQIEKEPVIKRNVVKTPQIQKIAVINATHLKKLILPEIVQSKVNLRQRPSNQKENQSNSPVIKRQLKLSQSKSSVQIGRTATRQSGNLRTITRSQRNAPAPIVAKALKSKNGNVQRLTMETRTSSIRQQIKSPQIQESVRGKRTLLLPSNTINQQSGDVTSTTSQVKKLSKKPKTMQWSVTRSTVQTRNRVQRRLKH